MAEIKCVIFDVGGVLLTTKIEPVLDSLNKKLGKEVFDRKHAFRKDMLKGNVKMYDYYKPLSEKSGVSRKRLMRMFLSEYAKIMKLNKDVYRIAHSLRSNGYKTGILSNVNTLSENLNRKRGVYKNFYPVIVSCKVGQIKPERSIFDIFVRKSKLLPQECAFIDDRNEFLSTPRKLGMKTILFKNAKQLEKDLRNMGVKI